LDFDHILMLSCNEGVMPKGSSDTSVIPYNIKKAFALNTSDDRTSIFAYYFYRLLKRCKDITLVYNASGSDTSPGEMSRFLLSLLVNNPEQISRISLQTQFYAHTRQPQPQDKLPEELHDYIERRKEKGVSPSAINTYMRCEKSFYYQYFRRLSEERDEDDTIDAASFGIFFHAAAEEFYRPLIGRQITSAALRHFIDNDRLLDPFIDTALQKTKAELYGERNNIDSGGMELLLKSIVKQYLKRLLKNDALNAPFSVVSLEQDYHTQYTINTPEGEITLNIGGNVDRLDRVTGSTGRDTLRVVDYKTGPDHTKTSIKTVADMFDDKIKGAGYYRQTCLYSLALSNDCQANPDHLPVAPALYYIRNKDVGGDEYHNPMLTLDGQPIDNIATIKAEYEEHLMDVLKEIFNKSTFDVAEDQSVCAYCPFVEMCQKA
ncbi:MAG: PD-(D/E)XK nuclease family protein, partial [Bacteroidaceae bacterium]|nr:PD-(D/E)XK nuclease family protein [Bacteroidaceae bacterium]